MSTAIHQIRLPEELERRLRARAAAVGTDTETYIVRMLEEKLEAPKSFRELFAPLQQAFAQREEGAGSLEQTFEQLRDLIYQSRRAKAS